MWFSTGTDEQLATSLYRCTALLLHSLPQSPPSHISPLHRSLLSTITQFPVKAFTEVAITTAIQCWQWILTSAPFLEFPVSAHPHTLTLTHSHCSSCGSCVLCGSGRWKRGVACSHETTPPHWARLTRSEPPFQLVSTHSSSRCLFYTPLPHTYTHAHTPSHTAHTHTHSLSLTLSS